MARISQVEWSGWRLDTKSPALVFDGNRNLGYGVDLDHMLTRDQFGWWVIQVAGKNWGAEAVHGFVTAVDEVLDFQKTAEYAPEAMRARVAEYVTTGY